MYNKKSKASAILAIITAVLLLVLMILLPFLLLNVEIADNPDADTGEGIGTAFAVLFGVVFAIIGYIVFYVSAIPFVIVGLVYGIRILKQQSRAKLIAHNRSLLIAACVLLPFLVVGMILSGLLILNSAFGVFPIIYLVIVALVYLASLIAQIVVIGQLKRMPEEVAPTAVEQ